MSQFLRYLKFLKYINGVPLDEYKEGDLIGTYEFDNITDCEQGVEYRWVDSGTLCDGYDKYQRLVKLKYDPDIGVWQDTSEFKKGALIEQWSLDCGVVWQYRWHPTGLTKCDGYALSNEEVYLISKDMGNSWLNVEPVLYRYIPVEGEEFNYDCVILTEPLEITIESDSDIGIFINSSKRYNSIVSLSQVKTYTVTFDDSCKYQYIVDWNEGSPPYLFNYTKEGTELGTMGKIDSHHYITSGTYKIKVWGSIGAIKDDYFSKPYTINSWGKGFASGFPNIFGPITTWRTKNCKDSIYWDDIRIYDTPAKGKYLSYIELGEGCLGYPELSEGLIDNNVFICRNSKFTDLKLDFTKLNTNFLIINCPNLIVTPKLSPKVNGIPNAYYYVRFEGCSKLTETPQGGMISNQFVSGYCRGASDPSYFGGGYYIGGDFCNCFKGCTSLTKINGPIITLRSSSMFEGCTGLTDLNGLEIYSDDTCNMFKDCINLTGQYTLRSFKKAEGETIRLDSFGSYIRDSMFENTKISYIDPYILEGLELYNHTLKRMYYNTLVTLVALNFGQNQRYVMNLMFSHSKVNNIKGLFMGLKEYPNMEKMFEYCEITDIEKEVFDYNTVLNNNVIDINRIRASSYPFVNSPNITDGECEKEKNKGSDLTNMFAMNGSLTNYPIFNGYPIWFWTNLYKNTKLLNTVAFIGCGLISLKVPPEWGGLADYYPMSLSFEGKGEYILESGSYGSSTAPEDNYIFILWGDGTYDYYSNQYSLKINTPHLFNENKKHIINIVTSDNAKVTIYPSKLTNIEDFGEAMWSFNYTSQFGGESININSIGPTHGLFKKETELDIDFNGQLTKIDPDFFTDCLNVTKLLLTGLNMTELGFQLKDYMPNLVSVENCFNGSTITNFDGICQGLTKLTNNIYFGSKANKIKANRAFKDCILLSNSDAFKKDCIDQADECFMNCTSLTHVDSNIDLRSTLTSAIRAYCNTGITKCLFKHTLQRLQKDCNFTEMFKDCTNLTTISLLDDVYSWFNLDGTLNLTRCFENCTALKETPSILTTKGQLKLWELEGFLETVYGTNLLAKKIIGTECFKGCTQLKDYDEIPDDWK